MQNYDLPTSEWEHSHALESGDEVTDTTCNEVHTASVHTDGGVTIDGETFSEREITAALADGVLKVDGLSHELATY